MKKKNMLIILVFLLTIGFASVSTTLVMNGTIGVAHKKSDFNVIFKNATVTGNTAAIATISENKRTITFETDKLSTVGDSAELVYKVKNDSTQYDANVSVSCIGGNPGYTNIVSEFAGKSLPLTAPELMEAQEVRMGKISVSLTKTYDASVTKTPVTCTLEIEGEERDSIVEYSNCSYPDGTVWEFVQKNSEYEFKPPCDGEYKVELWGAQGGNKSDIPSGYGAYVSGHLQMHENIPFYVYVGSKGSVGTVNRSGGGYNGGGNAQIYVSNVQNKYGGGGATDIRTTDGNWNNFESLKSRIMVAAGGGGESNGNGYTDQPNMSAGGLNGYSGGAYSAGGGASQTAGGSNYNSSYFGTSEIGSFGRGGFGNSHAGGGGSGYYGGGGGARDTVDGNGGGGSSFISGHDGCNAISKDSTNGNIIHTGQANHYSGYVFTDTVMIDGAGYKWTTTKSSKSDGMPTHDGKSTMVGNTGDGYAKITLISAK